ncbi:MAG: hypothetical protein ACR2HR_02705, partial [Euzebya sp.]
MRQRNGHIVYPLLQFEGDRPLQGVEQVVRILSPAVATECSSIVAWVEATQMQLTDLPVEELRVRRPTHPVGREDPRGWQLTGGGVRNLTGQP